MAKGLDSIKELLSPGKKEGKKEDIDEALAEEIVKRVLERYEKAGYISADEDEVPESVKEIIAVRTITSKTPVPIENYPSPIVRILGRMYERMKEFVDRIADRLVNNRLMRQIDFDLYAANIPLTAAEYVSIVITLSVVLAGATFLLLPLLLIKFGLLGAISIPIVAGVVFLLVFVLGLLYPRRKAIARGKTMDKELPFALRHLAVVIRSGLSLYKAMESIAAANYGIVSEEFRRTVKEISGGKTTEEALENLALRSHSRAMRRAVAQMIRVLRVGGNLSDAIKRIAEDLTFEQASQVREFSEKLNLIGVLFMFAGIVFPTLLAIINGIGNAPLEMNLLASFAMKPNMLIMFYLLGIPLFMLLIILYVRISDPLGE